MDLQKAKTLLSSINRLFIKMSKNPDDISVIERDLMLRRLQDLYAVFLDMEMTQNPAPPMPEPPPARKVEKQETPVLTPKPNLVKPELPVVGKVVPPQNVEKQETPVLTPKPNFNPPPLEPPIEKVVPTPVPPKAEAKPPVSFTDENEAINALFVFKEATDLSEKLSQAPITDLKISGINERISLIKDLFRDNAARYQETIETLNNLQNFAQAKDFLVQVIIPEFDWTAKNRQEPAKNFIKKIRRRYL